MLARWPQQTQAGAIEQERNTEKEKRRRGRCLLCFLLIRVFEMTSDNRCTAFSARGGGYFCK
jgi:hypothetical protein